MYESKGILHYAQHRPSMMPTEHVRVTHKQAQAVSQMSITPKVKILSHFKQIMGRLISLVRRGLIREPARRQFRLNQIQRLTHLGKHLKHQVSKVGNKRPVTRRRISLFHLEQTITNPLSFEAEKLFITQPKTAI